MSQPEKSEPDPVQPPITVAEDVVDEISEAVSEANGDDQRIARGLARAVSGTTFDSGRSPTGVAASALYIAGTITNNRRLSQKAIASQCNTSDMTIRSIYRNIPEAALEHDDGDLEILGEIEREKLEYLAELSARGDRPGWVQNHPINEADFR
jgi:hypothetical protein